VAFIRIFRPPGVTADQYDQVNAEARVDSDPPAGLMFHCAGEVDGAWQILDVWDSEADAQKFDDERLVPAIEKVLGMRPPGPAPGTQSYELHHLITT
jgi:hypothetical protein